MYSASNNINNYSIESKLQDVAATLRRERDQAHRSKGLAEERLRLVRSQTDAMEKTLKDLESKLKALQEKTGDSAKQNIRDLQQKVLQLTKEVQFQHSELVQKRDKAVGQQAVKTAGEKKRHDALKKLQAVVHARRSKLNNILKEEEKLVVASLGVSVTALGKGAEERNHKGGGGQAGGCTSDIEKLKEALEEDDRDGSLLAKWPRLLEQRAKHLTSTANENFNRAAFQHERICIAGYGLQLDLKPEQLLHASSATMTDTKVKMTAASEMEGPTFGADPGENPCGLKNPPREGASQ